MQVTFKSRACLRRLAFSTYILINHIKIVIYFSDKVAYNCTIVNNSMTALSELPLHFFLGDALARSEFEA